MTMKEWSVRTARLMVGIPDYQTYVEHRRQTHPGEPKSTAVEIGLPETIPGAKLA